MNHLLPGAGVKLSAQQQSAIQTIGTTSKPVTVLTGQAGAGKSTIINELKKSGWWTPTATTGKAAMHIEGSTVDSVFCINRNKWTVWSDSYLEYIMREVSDNIIIDEASMVGKGMGNLIADIAQAYKKRLLLVGDWAQAAPVKDGLILDSRLLDDYEFIKLTENHRQSEGEFMDVLNKLRLGTVDDQVQKLMKGRICETPPDDDTYVRMYATNRKTDNYNQARLWRHVADNGVGHCRLFAAFTDRRDPQKQDQRPRNEAFVKKAIDSSPFSHGEPMAIGCRALITCNSGPDLLFANGDTGTVVGGLAEDGRKLEECLAEYERTERRFRLFSLDVCLDRNGAVVSVPRMERVVMDPTGKVEQHAVSGFPLRLGYACTIHKAQGMTVEKAWVDMASLGHFPDEESRHGLAYVALSRTKTAEGLLLGSWAPQMVYCNPEIRPLL